MTMSRSIDGVVELARRIVRFGEPTVKRLPHFGLVDQRCSPAQQPKETNKTRLHGQFGKYVNKFTELF